MLQRVHQVQAEGTMVGSQHESFPVKAARLPNFCVVRVYGFSGLGRVLALARGQ